MLARGTRFDKPVEAQPDLAVTQQLINPMYGEVWLVDFTGGVGSEITKVRPAVVCSSDAIRSLPQRMVVPFTSWKPNRCGKFWHVRARLAVTEGFGHGRGNEGSYDVMQIRVVDLERFRRPIGRVSAQHLQEIACAAGLVMGNWV